MVISAIAAMTSMVPLYAQSHPQFVGIGDSLGEGVQSDNAFFASSTNGSQQNGYLNQVALKWGVPFALPLISSTKIGFAGAAIGRARISPNTIPTNLAVSGATTADVLKAVASTKVQREVDLVLAPTIGKSQIQIVEQEKPGVVFCWVGNDDIIGYVLDYSHLTHPSVTPLATFTAEYKQLMTRLKATGAKVVVANIPDLTKIGFMFDNADLDKYLGTTATLLQPGYYTTFATFLQIKLGLLSPSVLKDPNYVLSPAALAHVQKQVQIYNAVIQQQANAMGFPVVDAYAIVNRFITNPITIEGITIGTHYNHGAFGLDGVHPSDIGYSVFANAFIGTANAAYNLGIPEIPVSELTNILNADPFIDWDGSGIVRGRPNTGALETTGPLVGVSGNAQNLPPGTAGGKSMYPHYVPASPDAFMRAYYSSMGQDANTRWTNQDAIAAVEHILNIDQLSARAN